MLTISVELLHGTIRAGSADDLAVTGQPDHGDWPPSPARLFAAFVAADGTRSRCQVTTGAELAALENAPPPRVFADQRTLVQESPQLLRYVVVNHTAENTVQNYPARTNTRVRPGTRLAPRTPRITYVWDDLEVAPIDLAALRLRANRIGYLGCSDSPVRVSVSDGLPFDQVDRDEWVPDEAGTSTVPVPFPGATEVLDRMFDDFTAGLPVRRTWYRTEVAGYRGPHESVPLDVPEPWPLNYWLQLESPLPARRALDLAEALKSATLSVFGQIYNSGDDMPAMLHGHMPSGARGYQLAQWVPLLNVGGRHSDGRIRDAVVMLPGGTDPDKAERVALTLRGLSHLRLSGGREVCVHLRTGSGLWANNPRRWFGPARLWVSALPIVCERRVREAAFHEHLVRCCRNAGFPAPSWSFVSPSPNGAGIRQAVAAWCDTSELTRPEWVTDSSNSTLPGAPSLAPSEVFRREHGERRPYQHIALAFDTPVMGPMVLGRMRQFGMGLMAPQKTEEA